MEQAPVRATGIKNLEFKSGLVLVLTALLTIGFAMYVLDVRGAFEKSFTFTLTTDSADGLNVGMPVNYAGIPIGRITRISLYEGGVRLMVQVKQRDGQWLRRNSVFQIDRNLLGRTTIYVAPGEPNGPVLQEGSERALISEGQDLGEVINRAKKVVGQIEMITAPGAPLNQTLAATATLTRRMSGEGGLLGALTDEQVRMIGGLLTGLEASAAQTALMLAQLEKRLFAEAGTVDHLDRTLINSAALLAEAQGSVKRLDALLSQTQGLLGQTQAVMGNVKAISAEARSASLDLPALRREVEESLKKINHMMRAVNQRWPFTRDVELKTP